MGLQENEEADRNCWVDKDPRYGYLSRFWARYELNLFTGKMCGVRAADSEFRVNPKAPSTLNPQPQSLTPKPPTSNPGPWTLNPKP